MTTTTTPRRNRPPRLPILPELGGRTRPPRDGDLPCRSCGAGVESPEPDQVDALSIYRDRAPGLAAAGYPRPSVDVRVTRCDQCAPRRARAEALVTVHRFGSIPGTGEVEADRLDAALAALDLLGIRGDRTAALTRTPRDVRELIAALAPIGGAASWTARVAGGLGADSIGSTRWEFVPAELRQAAALAYRDHVHYTLESPEYCPPPPEGSALRGCLLCGRGTLRVKPSDARAAWGELVRVHPGELGGTRRPEPVSGFLCPACRKTTTEVGAPGIPAVERALLQFLGYSLAAGSVFTRPLGRAWAALPDGTPPNDHPWEHINLAKLRHDLDRAPRVHKVPGTGLGSPA